MAVVVVVAGVVVAVAAVAVAAVAAGNSRAQFCSSVPVNSRQPGRSFFVQDERLFSASPPKTIHAARRETPSSSGLDTGYSGIIRKMAFSIYELLLMLLTAVLGLLFTRGIRRAFSRFRSREHKAGKEQIYRHFPKQRNRWAGAWRSSPRWPWAAARLAAAARPAVTGGSAARRRGSGCCAVRHSAPSASSMIGAK